MFTLKEYNNLKNEGFNLKLDDNKRTVKVYKNSKYQGTIYNTNNSICFFGHNEFVKATGKEILNFFKAVNQLR